MDDLDYGDEPPPDATRLDSASEVLVVVDRVSLAEDSRERLSDSLAGAFAEGHALAEVLVVARARARASEVQKRIPFAEAFRCSTLLCRQLS